MCVMLISMVIVNDFFKINCISIIFDIVFRIHTRSHSHQTRQLKNRPASKTQEGLWFLQDLHCRVKFFVSYPAPYKAGQLSNSVLQDAGQDEKAVLRHSLVHTS